MDGRCCAVLWCCIWYQCVCCVTSYIYAILDGRCCAVVRCNGRYPYRYAVVLCYAMDGRCCAVVLLFPKCLCVCVFLQLVPYSICMRVHRVRLYCYSCTRTTCRYRGQCLPVTADLPKQTNLAITSTFALSHMFELTRVQTNTHIYSNLCPVLGQ